MRKRLTDERDFAQAWCSMPRDCAGSGVRRSAGEPSELLHLVFTAWRGRSRSPGGLRGGFEIRICLVERVGEANRRTLAP